MNHADEDANLRKCLVLLLKSGTLLASGIILSGMLIQSFYPSVGGDTILNVGVAVFVFLPVIRLACMLFFFLFRRNAGYALITFSVLLIIGSGILIGLHQ
ncbi:DUF1634 domain-containing protein [Klebsiella aerogenes]|uniref:DUF1634 domain-containing protein n=1 Tax=Klebsiella aerogenes TaxID=548 RepID=UPI0034D1A0FE